MNERLFFTSDDKLKWYCLKTFTCREFIDSESCYSFHSCIPLADGRVLLSGTLEYRKGTQSHFIFLYDSEKLRSIKEPSFGIVDLKMINLNTDVYYISVNRIERYCLLTNELYQLERPNFSHIQAGCCVYRDSVVLISGINCQAIECYDIEMNFWMQTSTLSLCLFEFSCIQITDNEILCINAKRTYRVIVSTGEAISMANNKMDINTAPVLKGNYVYTLSRNLSLARYSIIEDKWAILARSGCCIIQ